MSLKLAPNERKKIENRRREERDSRIWRRLSALLWLGEGVTEEEVAKRLGVCPAGPPVGEDLPCRGVKSHVRVALQRPCTSTQ